MDHPEPDYRRHVEIIDGIALTHIKLDKIEQLVGGGEVQILQKRYDQLFSQNRRLFITIGQALEALDGAKGGLQDTALAFDILLNAQLLRQGDSGNGSNSGTT